MAERELRRHHLVWLSAAAVAEARPDGQCCAADPQAQALLADWVGAGHPLIVARQGGDCPPGQLRLGLALPPALGKRRLAFRVARSQILRSAPPPPLAAAVAGALQAAWNPLLLSLLGVPALRAASPRLLGSAGMQVATGLPCLGPDSDLDLLLTPPDRAAARAVCRALALFDDPQCGPRVDGEIVNAAGDAVAWRELEASPRQVLVKSLDGVRLLRRELFEQSFPVAVAEAA